MAPKVGEEEARFWDIVIKIIAGVVAIGTLITGFQTLKSQGDQVAATRQEEYHRRFWEKKLDVYMHLCKAASSLALAESESDEYKQANHEMMLIYGGELQVVASPEVKEAFREFLSAISLTEAKPAVKGLTFFVTDLHRSLAALALACRQDSGSEFQLNDKQVQKFNEETEGIDKFLRKLESKIGAGK
jgi:hypothetical protein